MMRIGGLSALVIIISMRSVEFGSSRRMGDFPGAKLAVQLDRRRGTKA